MTTYTPHVALVMIVFIIIFVIIVLIRNYFRSKHKA